MLPWIPVSRNDMLCALGFFLFLFQDCFENVLLTQSGAYFEVMVLLSVGDQFCLVHPLEFVFQLSLCLVVSSFLPRSLLIFHLLLTLALQTYGRDRKSVV